MKPESKTYGYYPGCSLHSTGSEYDHSFRAVANRLGIELREVPNWICCGATAAHSTSKLLAVALPMRNLSLFEKKSIGEVVMPCAACFARFKAAVHEIHRNAALKRNIEDVIEARIEGSVKVLHPLEILGDALTEETSGREVTRRFPDLKVVCYYGCLLTRPPKVMQFDECEYPMSMDRLLQTVGFRTLDWSYKTDCCGAAMALTRTDIVLRLTHNILEEAKAVGANVISVACPLCHANLDTRQSEVEEKYGKTYGIPILYFTQLIGLAFGISGEELSLDKHMVSVRL